MRKMAADGLSRHCYRYNVLINLPQFSINLMDKHFIISVINVVNQNANELR